MVDNNIKRAAEVLGSDGHLRVAVNYGNSVLAQENRVSGKPGGVSVDLARELATQLNLSARFITLGSF